MHDRNKDDYKKIKNNTVVEKVCWKKWMRIEKNGEKKKT